MIHQGGKVERMRGFGSWRQFHPGIALLAAVVALAVLLGGQGLAKTMRVDRPLARELSSIDGVRRYALEDGAEGIRLELTLGRVPDLEQTIAKVLAAVGERRREPVAEIAIRDQRQGLNGVYYDLRFSLEEALATGRYTALRGDLDRLASRYRLDRARIYLGRQFIYVQLEKGPAYLYQALPRPWFEQQTQSAGGGV